MAFGIVIASMCVCVSINPELVHAITHHGFKPEPLNLVKRCKTTCLRSLLLLVIALDVQGLTWKAQFTPFWACPHHNSPFKLEPPNLDKRCKAACLWSLLFWKAIDHDLHGQHKLVQWLRKHSLGQDWDLCHTHDRHPISALSQTVAARWFYCSLNPLHFWESYLLLRTPCCAHTHSIAIDWMASKVQYCVWITAELLTSRFRTSVMHARYTNSTNQSLVDESSLRKFGRSKHRIVTSSCMQGNMWDQNQRTDS